MATAIGVTVDLSYTSAVWTNISMYIKSMHLLECSADTQRYIWGAFKKFIDEHYKTDKTPT